MEIGLTRRNFLIGLGGIISFCGLYSINNLRQSNNDHLTSSPSVSITQLDYDNWMVRENWKLPNDFWEVSK